MRLMIQDPTDANSMRLGEAIIDACKRGIDGAGAFAFVEKNGVDLFLGDKDFHDYIKNHNYVLIVGTDSITDYKAIDSLRNYCEIYNNLSVYAYIHDSRKYLFHPKLTWFETTTGGLSIIGSGNLTERGLFHNVEMYSYNELSSQDFAKLKEDWEEWLNGSIANNLMFDISDPIVDHAVNLSASKKELTFAGTKREATKLDESLSALYKKQPRTISIRKKSAAGNITPKQKPKKATAVLETVIPVATPAVTLPSINPVWTVSSTDRILVAEVPKASKRWKQVNFDKASFKDYFGATPGEVGGTYRILLKNVDATGRLYDTETRPSVSVKSKNWRFEINAAKGLDYPEGENRPYVIFSEVSTRSFIYELIMPDDLRYKEVDEFVKLYRSQETSKKKNNHLNRFITNVNEIRPYTPNLGLWKI